MDWNPPKDVTQSVKTLTFAALLFFVFLALPLGCRPQSTGPETTVAEPLSNPEAPDSSRSGGTRIPLRLLSSSPPNGAQVEPPPVIRLDFDAKIDPVTAGQSFSISPEVPGTLGREERALLFFPRDDLKPGVSYTVRLKSGLPGDSDPEISVTFKVTKPRDGAELLAAALSGMNNPTSLRFSRTYGEGLSSRLLKPGEAFEAGTGASIYSGEYLAPDRVRYTYNSEDSGAEGFRLGKAKFLRRRDLGNDSPAWTKYDPAAVLDPEMRSIVEGLQDTSSWGDLDVLQGASRAWLEGKETLEGQEYAVLNVRLPAMEAKIRERLGQTEVLSFESRVYVPAAGTPRVSRVLHRVISQGNGPWYMRYSIDSSWFEVNDRQNLDPPDGIKAN